MFPGPRWPGSRRAYGTRDESTRKTGDLDCSILGYLTSLRVPGLAVIDDMARAHAPEPSQRAQGDGSLNALTLGEIFGLYIVHVHTTAPAWFRDLATLLPSRIQVYRVRTPFLSTVFCALSARPQRAKPRRARMCAGGPLSARAVRQGAPWARASTAPA